MITRRLVSAKPYLSVDMAPFTLITASSKQQYADARLLFAEYAASLPIDLGFQRFGSELENVEAMYGPPNGCLLLIYEDDKAIACAAYRPLEEGICEVKRMYVQPDYRKNRLGRLLMEKLIRFAKENGYQKMRLDTLADMTAARNLYLSFGFYEIPAYYFNPYAATVYMEKSLL